MTEADTLGRNAVWTAFLHLAPRAASAIALIAIARIGGPGAAGAFALGVTYLVLASTTMKGLDDLTTREVARFPGGSLHLLGKFAALRIALAIAAVIAAALIASALRYDPGLAGTVLVMMACTVPDSIGYVAQAALLGLGHFRFPSIIVVVMNALKLTVACLAMGAKGSVLLVAWIWFAGSLAAAGALLLAAIWCARAVRQTPAYEPKVTPGAWLVAGTFLGISTLLALEAQTDTLVLSATWGQESVGWYGAASTLAFASLVVPQAYRLAVFPAMARMGRQSGAPLFLVFRKSIRDLSTAGGAMAVTLVLFAPQAVAIAFGESFIPSVTALRILSIVVFLVCVNEANSRFLLATERQGRVLLHVAAATILNVSLNLVLVPTGGIAASAAARLCSTALMALLNWRLASQMAPSQSMILALLPSTLGLATALAAALIMPNMPAFAALLAGLLAFLLAYFLVRRADGWSHANDCWR